MRSRLCSRSAADVERRGVLQPSPPEQRGARARRVEQSVQIRAENPFVVRACPLRPLGVSLGVSLTPPLAEVEGRPREDCALRATHVDLVTADGGVCERAAALDLRQVLLLRELRVEREQPEPLGDAGRALDAMGIADRLPEHLKAATYADDLAAVADVPHHGFCPALRSQPLEIGARVLAAGQDDQVGRWKGLARRCEAQVHLRVGAKRVEVGMVADTRQHRDHHAKSAADGLRRLNRVFSVEVQAVKVRQHRKHGFAGLSFEPVEAWLEQADITAEAVDDEADCARPSSVSERQASVPTMWANTPPRSMSATRITGQSTASANPMLAMSRSRRLISAGLPAPSTMMASYCAPRRACDSSTARIAMVLYW